MPALVYVARRRGEGTPRPGYIDVVVEAAREWELARGLHSLARDAGRRRDGAARARGIPESSDERAAIRHVVVRGRVQGVGYRAFVEDDALGHGLDGWVRNRRDGAVEAVFAGRPRRSRR